MSVPEISVGLPVYNGEKYLVRALTCLVEQEFENWELIISNNASTDNTRAICKEFASRDRRIRYVENESNIGATRNYNRVFELSKGKYFKWASHDDECAPSFFGRCLEAFETSPVSTVLVFARAEIIDEESLVTENPGDDISSLSCFAAHRLARLVF